MGNNSSEEKQKSLSTSNLRTTLDDENVAAFQSPQRPLPPGLNFHKRSASADLLWTPMAAAGGSRKTVTVGQIKVAVVSGDITAETADVIVCSASRDLDLSKGRASKALLDAAGDSLQDQCNQDYPNGLGNGEIAVLDPGQLDCSQVYLISLSKWTGPEEEEELYDLIQKCLDEASGENTIAIPSLGTGYLKYPADRSASLTFQCIEDYSKQNQNSSLDTVTIVIHHSDTAAFKAFSSEARRRGSGRRSTALYNLKTDSDSFGSDDTDSDTGSDLDLDIAAGGVTAAVSTPSTNIQINIKTGQLAHFKADVIVDNTAETLKLDNGGLSESLLKVAGTEMQDECDNNYPNGIKLGEVAVTGGYGLQCRKVYHGSLPKWSDKSQNAIKLTSQFVTKCLELANKFSVKSVAFPTIGTGSLEYPHKTSAKTMVSAITKFDHSHRRTSVKYITIVVYDQDKDCQKLKQIFEQEVSSTISPRAMTPPVAPAVKQRRPHFPSPKLQIVQPLGSAPAPHAPGTPDYFKHMYKSEPHPPSYWTRFHSGKSVKDWHADTTDTSPHYETVDPSTFNAIEKLFQDTWQAQFVGHGKDSAGLQNLNYTNAKVKKVHRIENIHTFKKYMEHRQDHFKKAMVKKGSLQPLEKLPGSQKGPVLTQTVIIKGGVLDRDIHTDINEHYLFHGTQADKVDTIVKQGLDARVAGDKAMFGAGVYCAESSTKADQYADYKTSRTSGNLKMLLVRMCLGEIVVQGQPVVYKRAPCKKCKQDKCLCNDEFFDSVVGDGIWNFREFVVYEKSQSYPEYLITYERV